MDKLDLTDYQTHAKPIVCRFDDQLLTMTPKLFSTGSVGWYASGKAKILSGDTYYPVQCSVTVTIIGSKNSHDQEGPSVPLGEPIGPLMGPEYPWNESPVLGANGEVLEGTGEVVAGPEEAVTKRKRARKPRAH